MPDIDVRATGPHEYAVVVDAGRERTRHTVRVPQRLLAELGLTEAAEAALVRESFAFLLEREPASAILREFELDVIARYFPEYPGEIGARLTG